MNRLKLLAAAMLLAVPIISACGDDIPPPPPTGSIDGLVSIEGQGVDAVSVTLSNGASATTANGGMYRFDGVEAGAYTVTISNYPADASFDQTSAAATIANDGETVTINFPGTFIRTSSIMGTVTVDNEGLNGITVTISGTGDSETLTDGNGQYAFTGLRAGNYTIEISGFDDEDVAFGATSSAASVGVGESKVVAFEGTYVRTSGVMGQVTADGQPQEGINVSLQGRGENRSMTTNSAGQFSFDELRRGDYAVGISGYDTDQVSFDVTSQSVTVAYGETANVPFAGTLLRTAGIMGTVTVAGVGPIANVTVTIQGEGETRDDMTDHMGVYEFENLPAGDYSVVISGFDDDEYGFPDGTSATVTVELQETGSVPFDGIMLRTAAIEGTVTVGDDDAPLPGVMVTVSGGPRDEEHSRTTNNDGEYLVENLHAGTYSVTISGYDTREYGFDPTTTTLTVDLRDTGEAAFQGDLLRTAGVSGRVHVGGMGLPGVTVTLSGEESREGTTNADGQYGFSGLAAGDYTVTISGWDEVEYAFDPAMEIEDLELDESRSGVNFAGRSLRTAGVMGNVTVEGAGLPGIAVTLIKVSGTAGELLGTKVTDADGAYSFRYLLAGAYRVMIAGYADEHAFADGTTWQGVVLTDMPAQADFAATIIRTAKISGMVTLDSEAMKDIEVTLSGEHAPDDNTRITDADGMYEFDGLRKGDYTVTMTNPDAAKYDFPTVEQPRNLTVGQDQSGVNFAGTRLRRASISGQVAAEYDSGNRTPLEGVTVTLSGDADDEEMTDANGEYNFPGLAGGKYTVTIANPNADAYEFPNGMQAEVTLGDDTPAIQDFIGEHRNNGMITGVLFLDEGPEEDAYHESEPKLVLPEDALPEGVTGIPMLLQGPTIDRITPGLANADGTYEFTNLEAGAYRVLLDLDTKFTEDGPNAGDVLTHAGYRFAGELTGVGVQVMAADGSEANFPFRITMQTIHVGAVMGTSEMATETRVGGVKLTLYPTAEDANNGTNALGTMTTGSDDTKPDHGMAKLDFARAMDLGPGGQGKDHLVFAKVVESGHDDLEVADNAHIEIQYNATDRVSMARAAARLLNTAVNFQWWVKSDAEARDGNEFLGGWNVVMGEETIATGDSTEGADPKAEPEDHGKASYSGAVAIADLKDDATATYTVKLDVDTEDPAHDAMQPDGGENWKQSAALTHTHNALTLPAANMAEDNDLGAIYVTWTTQTLVVGVHREMDDVYGYAKYESVVNGDHRPSAMAGEDMKVMVMWEAGRNNRLEVYDGWDEDCDEDPDDEPSEANKSVGSTGVVKFPCLPADQEWTVRFEEGANRDLVTDLQDIQTFGEDLMEGMTIGSFGGASGAMPEVRICSTSIAVVPGYESGTDDEYCSTFGYQWTTGSISGAVGAVSGLGVALEAVTTEHGQQDDDETTGTGGSYSFSGLQDGTYTVTASGNDEYSIVGAATYTKNVYHDEACWGNPDPDNSACSAGELDGPDADGDYTYINVEPQSWILSRLGLEVRGYVANVSHEHNNVVRGDETAEGLMLEIKAYSGRNSATTGQPIPTGGVLGTAAVQSDGSYKFENLPAGSYVITAKNVAGSYEALQSGPTDNIGGAATAQDYAAITDEQMLTGTLPTWDYENSVGLRVGPQTVTVGTGLSAVDNVFHNFALLHADGTFSGRVREATGDASGIAVELERCETYVAADPGDPDNAVDPTPEECRGEDWGPQRDDASRAGNWDFPSLREGYYVVNVAAVNHRRAKWDADGINDDADDCGPGSDMPEGSTAANCDLFRTVRAISDLRGKRAFNPGGQTFYVYNSSLRDADEMAKLSVKGVTTPKRNPVAADHAELSTFDATAVTIDNAAGTNEIDGSVTGTVTWRAASVAVKATVSPGASYVVRAPSVGATGAAGLPTSYTPSSLAGARVPLPYDGTTRGTPGEATATTITVAVTGENGYNDHMYTFAVSRAAPQDNELVIADFTPNPEGGNVKWSYFVGQSEGKAKVDSDWF